MDEDERYELENELQELLTELSFENQVMGEDNQDQIDELVARIEDIEEQLLEDMLEEEY